LAVKTGHALLHRRKQNGLPWVSHVTPGIPAVRPACSGSGNRGGRGDRANHFVFFYIGWKAGILKTCSQFGLHFGSVENFPLSAHPFSPACYIQNITIFDKNLQQKFA
jgi:hypothetical protein